ncbi:type II toxin-antitoxin system MqsA family antitoxin [Sorangium sp. So ce1182]|uniref:type II toxin-antitoxin system MqsA family antitoxin n=1 Tax=unclassified Sorangium TaxID=2621164 RepID=UPI003F634627
MKCVICKSGDVQAGTTTFTVERDGRTYVLRQVPARVCTQCGEAYFEAEVTKQILDQVEQASRSGAEVAVLHYKAA